MRVGIFRQGIGKPTQGVQLRGSNHLTNGLVAFCPFSCGAATFGASGPVNLLKTLDIGPNAFDIQWQNYSNIKNNYDSSPWGVAAKFGRSNAQADQNFWLAYRSTQLLLDKMPAHNAPRTLSVLILRDTTFDSSPQNLINYGNFNFAPAPAQYWAMLYKSGLLYLYTNPNQVWCPFVSDSKWHMVSCVFPDGFSLNTDIKLYIDGFNIPLAGSNGVQAIDTQLSLNRQDRCFAVGQDNYEFSANGTQIFHGLMAGMWVWNRALTPNQQLSHALDPFQMIARPRSFITSVATVASPPTPPPTCNLTTNHASIPLGQAATLSWTTTNTPTSASIDQGIGSVTPVAGSVMVSPTSTTTYHLTVTNDGGSSFCQVTVAVTNAGGSCSCPDDVPYFEILG